jgi:hypothetical protein
MTGINPTDLIWDLLTLVFAYQVLLLFYELRNFSYYLLAWLPTAVQLDLHTLIVIVQA